MRSSCQESEHDDDDDDEWVVRDSDSILGITFIYFKCLDELFETLEAKTCLLYIGFEY